MNSINSDNLTGKCTCGKVKYKLKNKPMFVHCCHCTWCQRETGSAFAVNALIESSEITIESGNIEKIEIPSNSGFGQILCRCSDCKITVWSHYGGAKDLITFVRVGTLNNPSLCTPDINIYTSTKQNWVILNNSIPSVEEYYKRSEYWTEESINRYKKVLGK